jgi:serine/threonine-protein kinase
MGTVYRARDPILDRMVALKTVSPGLLSKGETMQRFQREARAAARLQHRNIVTIYELGECDGTLYIAMELLEGMDLAHAMVPADRLSAAQKIQIVVDVCRGLDFAHKRGVVHRDVKPANIRLLLDGSVKIVDFGIARFEDSSMTKTGLIMGTPSYIAPEVLKGARVDHRCDIWAVGIMFQEMLSGKLPYDATTIAALVYKIVHEPPPPLDVVGLGLPPVLGTIVAKALAKDPAERYLDLAQMANELQAAMGLQVTAETPLFGAAREQAYARDVKEARRCFETNDLEKALEAARRARALDPSRSEIVLLVQEIEDRLQDAPTLVGTPRLVTEKLPLVPVEPTRVVATPGLPMGQPTAANWVPPQATPVPAAPVKRLPTAVLTELRARGASVFREIATFGEPPSTAAACLSPVKDVLATAGSDGAIRIWDLHTRTRLHVLRTEMHFRTGHDALATALAFSPDGALLASGHVDGGVHLWDMGIGQEVPVKFRHDAAVGAVAFSPDGAVLATGGMDSNLKLWDVGAALSGESRRALHRQPSAVTALCFADGGSCLVTGHANRILRVLEATTARLQATLRGPEALVSLLCPAPDGTRMAVASHDKTVRLFDLKARSELFAMTGHKKTPTALSFFADGNHLASVALDNSVQLWDLEARSTLAALWGPSDESFAGVALFGDGDHIAVALADGRIRLWGPAGPS